MMATVLQTAHTLLREQLKTTHGRIILAGLLVGLCYFPVWLTGLITRANQGSSGLPLMTAMVFLGLQELWKHRKELARTTPSEEDRLLGHILILSGVVLFPFCRFEIWSQAMIWLVILGGIACSCWGVSFFRKYPLVTLLFLLSVYPKPGLMARILWQTFTPPNLLENFMAWSSSLALQALGQPAFSEGAIVRLQDDGAVEVAWGCNGFNMAFPMAAAGLLLGIFLKQGRLKTVGFVVIGVILALLFNIPRIMLLAVAFVYWGQDHFDFWHSHWGGQIFSAVLFTVYYYLTMWLASFSRHS